jgi:hypothetical protein
MIDGQAAQAIGAIIVREVERLPQLLAVAISYETAQSQPALYLAYETAEHCMTRLRANATNASIAEVEARRSRYTGDDEHYAVSDRLGRQIGDVFNTGNWINPASPFLLDIDKPDPVIQAWANRAFAAILDAVRVDDEDIMRRLHRQASEHLRGTLWAAIDHARRTCPADRWPPISFVQSFDDQSEELITVMATRQPTNP